MFGTSLCIRIGAGSPILYPPRIVVGGKALSDWYDPVIQKIPLPVYFNLARYTPGLPRLERAIDEAVMDVSQDGWVYEVGGTRRRSGNTRRGYAEEEMLVPHLWLHLARLLRTLPEWGWRSDLPYETQARRVAIYLRRNMLNHDKKAHLDVNQMTRLPWLIKDNITKLLVQQEGIEFQVTEKHGNAQVFIPEHSWAYAPWACKAAFYPEDLGAEDDPEYSNIHFAPAHPIAGYRLDIRLIHPSGNPHPDYRLVNLTGAIVDTYGRQLDINLQMYISPWPTEENGRLKLDQRAGHVSTAQKQAISSLIPGSYHTPHEAVIDGLESGFPLDDANRALCYLIRMTFEHIYASKKRSGLSPQLSDMKLMPQDTQIAIRRLRDAVADRKLQVSGSTKDEALQTIVGMLSLFPFHFLYFGKLNGFAKVFPRAGAIFHAVATNDLTNDAYIANRVEMPAFDLVRNGSFALRHPRTGIEWMLEFAERSGVQFPREMSQLAKICWLFEVSS